MDLSEVDKFEAQVKKTLKLSEAIRIGASKRPGCRGFLFKEGKSCALGAAYEGLGYAPIGWELGNPGYPSQYETLKNLYGQEICQIVMEKNDNREHRESIADWLESKGY